ncbi:SUR7/PalI family-domain-containing protein [Tricladium varicosporioides]|nr:SUR7/PalI family-domain-containing protein [Hymenoscyphus varicosporioides]
MVLPSFKSLGTRRRERNLENSDGVIDAAPVAPRAPVTGEASSDRTLTHNHDPGVNIKRATRTRKTWVLISCFFFFISVIFLILTIIGNINKKAVVRDTWFFYLDLTNIIPVSTGGSITLVNSLARSLGLHDFYQIGLWNFCEGYNDEGITYCSPNKMLYWFNPVEILLDELLAGATITLPAQVNNILDLIKIASHVMFGFFLTGVCMNFVNIFLAFLPLYSRWWSLPIAIWTFISALLTTAAAIIATAMFIIFRNVITSQGGLNIGASVGTQMFAFMWVGAASSIFGWLIHLCLSCCCASRRDVRTGRRKGSKKAYGNARSEEKERPVAGSRFRFRRRRTTSDTV